MPWIWGFERHDFTMGLYYVFGDAHESDPGSVRPSRGGRMIEKEERKAPELGDLERQ